MIMPLEDVVTGALFMSMRERGFCCIHLHKNNDARKRHPISPNFFSQQFGRKLQFLSFGPEPSRDPMPINLGVT